MDDYTKWAVMVTFINTAGTQVTEMHGLFDSKADADAEIPICRAEFEYWGIKVISISAKPDIMIA